MAGSALRLFDLYPASQFVLLEGDERRGVAEVTLDRMRQRDESFKWAVRRLGAALNADGDFEHEPIPSERDEEFFARCRYPSVEDAVAQWNRFRHCWDHYPPDPPGLRP